MSVSVNQEIIENELYDYIGNNVGGRISAQIVWHSGNLPANIDSNLAGLFAYGTSLTPGRHIASKNEEITASDMYNALNVAFAIWTQIRRVSHTYVHYGYSNGGAVPVYSTSSSAMSHLTTSIPTDITNIVSPYIKRGKIIKVTDIQNLCNVLYNTWASVISSRTLSVSSQQFCHSNCHSSCHGSGGRR